MDVWQLLNWAGIVFSRLTVDSQRPGDDVIDNDIILIWGHERRVITGADILGRLMRGIISTTQGLVPAEEKE